MKHFGISAVYSLILSIFGTSFYVVYELASGIVDKGHQTDSVGGTAAVTFFILFVVLTFLFMEVQNGLDRMNSDNRNRDRDDSDKGNGGSPV